MLGIGVIRASVRIRVRVRGNPSPHFSTDLPSLSLLVIIYTAWFLRENEAGSDSFHQIFRLFLRLRFFQAVMNFEK